MRDARELVPAASFSELGFELRSCPTRCTHFNDEAEVVKLCRLHHHHLFTTSSSSSLYYIIIIISLLHHHHHL